jgi:hypothetical protein
MAINVLLVIDGAFLFKTNVSTPDFTFNTLVGILTGAGFQVTKANREPDPDADIQDFNFATSANLLDYDVIWMIGDGGFNDTSDPPVMEGTKPPLDAAQLNAIANFMEQGGGVFAVGDHYSLGSSMCGQIPRVRLMRSWYGSGDTNKPAALALVPDNFPVFGIGRADTSLINPSGTYPRDRLGGQPHRHAVHLF